MDLNQVTYFLNLAQSLNFTEAARQSGVSQPSLTRAIQRLEDELGGPLLYRDGKDTRLTALGRDVQVEFMRIQSSLDAVAEIAETSVIGRRRRLTIGIATTIAPATMAVQMRGRRLLRMTRLIFASDARPKMPRMSSAAGVL